VELKAGQVWVSPNSGLNFKIKKVTKDYVLVDVQRNGRDRDGRYKLIVNERKVPHEIWWAFSKAYTELET
jgi:hypothetical protein